jgi:hypothetical protein
MNWDTVITTAPYNTLGLPSDEEPDLTNPQISDNKDFQTSDSKSGQNVYTRSNRVPLGNENNFFDPTAEMVNNYLKTNKSMYDNRGKYFDTYLFNQKFDEYIREKNSERLLKEKVRLNDLNNIENIQVQPYELPLNKLLINFKNVWFKFFDDIINLKNPFEDIKTMDMFYFGITFIVIFILYIMLSYIFD